MTTSHWSMNQLKGFADEREQDLGSDAEENMRRDKRLSLDDYGDVPERPVKRRFYGKSPDLEGAFPAPASRGHAAWHRSQKTRRHGFERIGR